MRHSKAGDKRQAIGGSAAWRRARCNSPAVRQHWLRAAAVLLACAVVAPRAAYGEDAPATVTCRARDDARAREFALRPAPASVPSGSAEPRWQLSMREAESKTVWIDLLLPGAKPVITGTTATLSYRNANGGRQVDLDVSPAGSHLEVWVDYGLEVNIEPDLDPRVDRLNTDGPLTALDCVIRNANANRSVAATPRPPAIEASRERPHVRAGHDLAKEVLPDRR